MAHCVHDRSPASHHWENSLFKLPVALEERKQERTQERKRRTPKSREHLERDDFIAPISIESYVEHRLKHLVHYLEDVAPRLAIKQQCIEILFFIFHSTGALLAAFGLTEYVRQTIPPMCSSVRWPPTCAHGSLLRSRRFIALTVSIGAVLMAMLDYWSLRQRVEVTNRSLHDLRSLLLEWNSHGMAVHRNPQYKDRVIRIVENALLSIVAVHVSAAAKQQLSGGPGAFGDDSEQAAEAQAGGNGQGSANAAKQSKGTATQRL